MCACPVSARPPTGGYSSLIPSSREATSRRAFATADRAASGNGSGGETSGMLHSSRPSRLTSSALLAANEGKLYSPLPMGFS